MTTTVSPRRAPGLGGWFADRSLKTKFGILVAVVGLALGGLLVSVLSANADVRQANTEFGHLTHADELLLGLTRGRAS